jgi:hypothetical protein
MTDNQDNSQAQKTLLSKSLGMVVATARQDGMSCRDAFLIVSMLAAELAAQGVPSQDLLAMSNLLTRIAGHRA